jgi:peptidyl-prolyl cis-trans isomerase-like 4
MIGDIPFAAVRPPENILFVCKLNPVTADEDLELIFSRFGKILSCEVVRDRKSGDSLQYAFIEFDVKESAEQVSHPSPSRERSEKRGSRWGTEPRA